MNVALDHGDSRIVRELAFECGCQITSSSMRRGVRTRAGEVMGERALAGPDLQHRIIRPASSAATMRRCWLRIDEEVLAE
jgi:hypothetical protein